MIFKFKQFAVAHDKCAMKIGTDGVLLGAWTPIDANPNTILDIGSGSGIIALMLAQRTNAMQIDAIEIEENAYEQCVDNFENSPWSDRLFCYHAGFDEFVEDIEEQYDLIVSNPPFFTETQPIELTENNTSRSVARFNESLPFDVLLQGVTLLLAENGLFCMVIPFLEENNVIDLAEQNNLFTQKITRVRGTKEVEIKRSLLCFGRNKINTTVTDELIIEVERHVYTSEYQKLVQDFYLKM